MRFGPSPGFGLGLTFGRQGSTPPPDPVFARIASVNADIGSHLGHSLTSDYISHGEWPGHLKRITASMGITDAENKNIDCTTPGAGIQSQWEHGDTRYGAHSPVSQIGQYRTLMMTEAGPPAHLSQAGGPTALMTDTLDYALRFACNLVENGAGNDMILWPCWPDNRGPGWTPAIGDDGVPPAGVWASYGFRDGLEEYEDTFKYVADYLTYKVNALYPALGGAWRCWICPSHRFWMRVYDDIQLGLVPGATTLQDMFSQDRATEGGPVEDDHIHSSPLTGYGLGLMVASMLYQRDLSTVPGLWVPGAYTAANGIAWPALPTGRLEYYHQINNAILADYEPAGMGGTSGAEPRWTLAEDGDPMPLWTFANPNRDQIPDPEPDPEVPADALAVVTPSDITGLTFSPALPAATGGLRTIAAEHQSPIAAGATYLCMRVQRSGANGPLFGTLGTTAQNWNADKLSVAARNSDLRFLVSREAPNELVVPFPAVPLDMAPHTIEGWYASGAMHVSVDGVTPVSAVSPAYAAFTTLYLNLYGDGYLLGGLVVMPRVPNNTERAGIRAALET